MSEKLALTQTEKSKLKRELTLLPLFGLIYFTVCGGSFGAEPMVHVHPAKDQLGVMVVGPRLGSLAQYPDPPSEVTSFNQGAPLAPPVRHTRNSAIVPATDNWPFLYMKEPHLPRHYTNALLVVLLVSVVSVFAVVRGAPRRWSWEFFFLGAGFMLLETKSIIQFSLLWGSTGWWPRSRLRPCW